MFASTTIELDCPRCARHLPRRPLADAHACPGCGHRFRWITPPSLQEHGLLERCIACGEYRLFRQKDFNRKVGLGVVAGSAALSLALLPFSPLLAYVVLFTLALVDLGLYRILPEVVICYRCHARHRGHAVESPVKPFDLLTAELVDKQVREEGTRTPRR